MGASLEHLADAFDNAEARILAETLNEAIAKFLETNKSPSRKVNEPDNRSSHFYLALYWAEAVADQDKDVALAAKFKTLADRLAENEAAIGEELLGAQGKPVDVGGYYRPDDGLANRAMRPSSKLSDAIEALLAD